MRILLALLAVVALLASDASQAAEAGQPAPPFALPDAAGETVSLEKLRGKVVLVDFWASWCGPCKRSFPWMNELQRKYGERGFAVVAVNVDKKRSDAERFLRQTPAQFAIAYDPGGLTPAAYGVPGMPTSYLVDPSGRVVHIESGFRDERKDDLEERIRALLPRSA